MIKGTLCVPRPPLDTAAQVRLFSGWRLLRPGRQKSPDGHIYTSQSFNVMFGGLTFILRDGRKCHKAAVAFKDLRNGVYEEPPKPRQPNCQDWPSGRM
jgi:hypothetical protein